MPNEPELLKSLKNFDLDALGLVYDQYSPGIYRYAMRLLGNENLAEDCVADTFSRFLKALRNRTGPENYLQAYLYRIAHNWITDHYRRNAPLCIELEEIENNTTEDQTERIVETQIEMERVRLALRSLTPDQRQVVILKYFESWGNEEVAAALNKPVGSIKALQHRAIESLRKVLNQHNEKNDEKK